MVEIFLESADPKEFRFAQMYLPLTGVLTTPASLAWHKTDPVGQVQVLSSLMNENQKIFVQAISNQSFTIDQEAAAITDFCPNAIIEIPAYKAGIQAIKTLSKTDISTAAAACFSELQAFMAAQNGAKYVIFYVNRLQEYPGGLDVIAKTQTIFKTYGYSTKILCVGFRNRQQISDVLLMGVEAIALTYPVLQDLANDPNTTMESANLSAMWQQQYHTNSWPVANGEDEETPLKKEPENEVFKSK